MHTSFSVHYTPSGDGVNRSSIKSLPYCLAKLYTFCTTLQPLARICIVCCCLLSSAIVADCEVAAW